ncbi:MAG: Uncharacterised protein [Gammaproteobacteria bacterium]|nr:MAG: Uncharacterised protein [Gammaproteobacteria bacterium]
MGVRLKDNDSSTGNWADFFTTLTAGPETASLNLGAGLSLTDKSRVLHTRKTLTPWPEDRI